MTISALELTATLLTTVMLRMHFLALDSNVFTNNRLLALATYSCWGFNDYCTCLLASHAIGFTFILFVGLATKFCATTSTEEAVRMVHPISSVDALVNDGFQASVALGSIHVVEVVITIGFTLVFHKATILEGFVAVRANKAFWVEGLVHGVCDRSNNHIGASSTRRS